MQDSELAAAIEECLTRDRHGLRQRLRRLSSRPDGPSWQALREAIAQSRQAVAARAASLPPLSYPEELPVAQNRESIARAIAQHPVVILQGETGSGKSTQLPKICLELGRGMAGRIGVTQPRRIAARGIASFLGRELKDTIGCKIRFHDHTGPQTLVKVMTDGMLLAELSSDPWLSDYDTLIIDEAHERNLNIDFLLGYLKQLLPRRRDLKVIVSSATLDTEKFSRHFAQAPVLAIAGRLHPVEVRYRPMEERREEEEPPLPAAVLKAVDEAFASGRDGDILVFLPGEREIRECAQVLRHHRLAHVEVLPLYARLSAAEQERIFSPPEKRRRIVLSTNVAETSLTVPGIRFVIDSGLARIGRIGSRGQVRRLPVEEISRSSADQRMGRCGRLGPGVCIRLYEEVAYLSRPLFTDPEILRASLDAVLLSLLSLKLGDPDHFPFLDAPDPRALRDAYRLLEDLSALDEEDRLTDTGKRMARLPVDPRIARLILEGEKQGCLAEILILAAGLSLPDPRERPFDAGEAVDALHRRFDDPRSDFLSLLNLWRFLEEGEKTHPSQNRFRRFLKENHLSYVRVREWREIHQELRRIASEMGFHPRETPADYPTLHKTLLAGFLDHVGFHKEQGEYAGVRNVAFRLHPGSGLARKRPTWIVAAELMETTRLYARTVAAVEPEWIEAAAGEQVKRQQSDPHWEKNRAQVVAFEKGVLLGLTLYAQRKVHFGPLDPETSREIFLRSALVQGEYVSNAPFHLHNRRLITELEELEQRTRRPESLLDEEAIFAFFDARVPRHIHQGATFEAWRREEEKRDRRLLFLTPELARKHAGSEGLARDFPGSLTLDGLTYPLEYRFGPGEAGDGVTLVAPLPALAQIRPEACEWLVPGLLREKVLAFLKALPHTFRLPLHPLPETVEALLARMGQGGESFLPALTRAVKSYRDLSIPEEAWRQEKVPSHLFMNFKVTSGDRTLGEGRDLLALRRKLGVEARAAFGERPKASFEKEGVTRWEWERLPRDPVPISQGGIACQGFPALSDREQSVALTLLSSREEAELATRAGLRRLMMLALPSQTRHYRRDFPLPPGKDPLPPELGEREGWRQAFVFALFDRAFRLTGQEEITDRAGFEKRLEEGRLRLQSEAQTLAGILDKVMSEYRMIRALLSGVKPPLPPEEREEVERQLSGLVYKGFLQEIPADRLTHLPRYLAAIRLRLERRGRDPLRETQRAVTARNRWRAYRERKEKGRGNPALEEYRWLLEEWMVSLFAQDLKTAVPISEKRLDGVWSLILGK